MPEAKQQVEERGEVISVLILPPLPPLLAFTLGLGLLSTRIQQSKQAACNGINTRKQLRQAVVKAGVWVYGRRWW